jgi:Na+/glutamate symporter
MSEQRPASSAAFAGMFLLAALITCAAAGLGIGWLAGSPTVGVIAGGMVGIPVSFYLVYRQYRDI